MISQRPSYLDIELQVRPRSGSDYPVEAYCAPLGHAHGTMRLPFAEADLQGHLAGMAPVAKDREVGAAGPADLTGSLAGIQAALFGSRPSSVVRDFGQQIFESLIAGEVRDLYEQGLIQAQNQGQELRLKLSIEPAELAALPWEFLYDPHTGSSDYLCLSRPIVRYPQVMHSAAALTVSPPVRVLGMVSAPADLVQLDATAERRWLEQAFGDLRQSGGAELTWVKGQTWRDLQEAVAQGPWHIFHFIGHGGFDGGEGFIALCDEAGKSFRVSGTELGRLLDPLKPPGPLRLVLLNSCCGAEGSTRSIFSSTAATLVGRGIPAVVAMQFRISDTAAIEFTRTFYRWLASGLPVDEAMLSARKALSLTGRDTLEWGTPVLHTWCTDALVFAAPAAAGATQEPGWCWCSKCQGMFFTEDKGQGTCPADQQPHDGSQSYHYSQQLGEDADRQQGNWRRCGKCQGMFFGGGQAQSVCPTDGRAHDGSGSRPYALWWGDGTDRQQGGWRWCSKCQGMFFGGNEARSVCPADHKTHDGCRSGPYMIFVT